jgi:hypothetical protein
MKTQIATHLHSDLQPAGRGSSKFFKALIVGAALILFLPDEILAGQGDTDMDARFGRPVSLNLAQDGVALHDVVISPDASRRTRDAAEDLVRYLDLITGARFQLTTGDGSSGIAVGSWNDFPSLDLENLFRLDDPARADDHIVLTHGSGIYLVGASGMAAQHAVWTFLYNIGYRQFFPTDTWEVIPDKPSLRVEMSTFESPSFITRGGPRNTAWTDDDAWDAWSDRNRMSSAFSLRTSHAYGDIIRRNQDAFDTNPEFLAKVNGVYGGGRGDKFRISNPDLRQLVIDDAVQLMHRYPDRVSISLDPSDGGDWCETEEEAEFGSVSDRVVYLANVVAEAINELGYGEKYVGIYAYNQHSLPPEIEVHPNVVVSVATEFIRGAYTVGELIEAWSQRASIIGIRDYYDTYVWSQGMPRRGPGGNVNWVKETLPFYHAHGARFMHANSTDSWAVNGLGYYVSARLMWDIDADAEELVEDFLEKLFGDAIEPMRRYYEVVARGRDRPRTNSDLLAAMYGALKEAYEATSDPAVIARLNELVLYTRYVELWLNLESQSDREAVYRHAWRMQSLMLSPITQLYRHIRTPWGIPSEANPGGSQTVGRELTQTEPWTSNKPFTQDEIMQYVHNGLATYEKDDFGFELVDYSEILKPAAEALDLPQVRNGSTGRGFRGRKVFYTWLEEDEPLTLQVTGGTISHYRDRGNVRFSLHSPKEVLVEPVDTDESVPPDGNTYEITLRSPYSGLHTLIMNDGNDRTMLEWERGHPMTMHTGINSAFSFEREVELYFYVPKGTKVVGGYVDRHSHTTIFDSEGNEYTDWRNEDENEGYFNIPVAEGKDGTLWKIESNRAIRLRLMTVPPYVARNAGELLLPAEVLDPDFIPPSPDQPKDDENKELPKSFELRQNYPNPFNPSTRIQFAVPEHSHVTIDVYNIIGQRVRTLLNEEKEPGIHEVVFDASRLSSGIYLYRLQTGTYTEIRQMVLVR